MLLLPDGWVCFLLFSVLNRIFSTGQEWGLSAGVWGVGEVGVTGNGKGGLWEHHVAGPFILQRECLLNLFKISVLGPDCWRAGSGQQVKGQEATCPASCWQCPHCRCTERFRFLVHRPCGRSKDTLFSRDASRDRVGGVKGLLTVRTWWSLTFWNFLFL